MNSEFALLVKELVSSFWCSKCSQIFLLEPLQAKLLCPFDMPSSFFERFLACWHTKMFQAFLVLYYVSTRISHFSQEPWRMGAKCAHRCWSVALRRPSQWTENICVCVYTFKYTYTQTIYTCLFYLYISIENHFL